MHAALARLGQEEVAEEAPPRPAVAIRSSLKKGHLICLECGKKKTMLRRHLRNEHGMTPEEYRLRWKLRDDYPVVAPEYAQVRRDMAKKIGLGRKPGQKVGPNGKVVG